MPSSPVADSPVADRLATLLGPAVLGTGVVIDSVVVAAAGRQRVVKVYVDLPEDAVGSADLDTVAGAARAVGEVLDTSPETADLIGAGPYSLEVSTPGVDRPLRERRHWSRARSRLVTVAVAAGGSVTGRVVAVDDVGVHLDVKGRAQVLAWDAITGGQVQVEFKRKPVSGDDAVGGDVAGDVAGDDKDSRDEGATWTST